MTLLSINVGIVKNCDGYDKCSYHERYVEIVVVLCGKICSQVKVTTVRRV